MKTSERIWERADQLLDAIRSFDREWPDDPDKRRAEKTANKAYRYEQAYKRLRAAQRDWEHYEETGVGCPKGRVW